MRALDRPREASAICRKVSTSRPFVDELVDRFPEPVTGVAVDPEEDRRVGALRGLERRRELERVPGPGAVVMVADER